jgi:RNA polymerase sigma-70 factor (sigma-E family)
MDSEERVLPRRLSERGTAKQGGGLDELYSQHEPEALKLAYLLTGTREEAEDLVQDAFVRVIGRFHDVRNRNSFGAYIRRTVVNLANSRFRRRKVESDYRTAELERGVAAAHFPDVATQHYLRDVLFRLPARQRAAIVLRYYEDLSEEQTADVLDCSAGSPRRSRG